MLKVEEKVTFIWQNIHPEKFDPYTAGSKEVKGSTGNYAVSAYISSFSLYQRIKLIHTVKQRHKTGQKKVATKLSQYMETF